MSIMDMGEPPSMSSKTIVCDTEKEWHDERRKSIGGSDAPALYGLGRVSAFRIALEKRGKAPPREETEDMAIGKALEPGIAALTEKRTGMWFIRDEVRKIRRHANGFMHATLDGYSLPDDVNRGKVLQIKLSSSPPSEWEENTPQRLALEVQMQHEMFSVGYAEAIGAVLCTAFGFKLLIINATLNDAFVKDMVERERRFWDDIHAGIMPPPSGSPDDGRLIRKLHPKDNGKTVLLREVEHVLDFEEYDAADHAAREAQKKCESARQRLEKAIGDYKHAVLINGVRLSLSTTSDGKRILRREWNNR